MRLKFDCAPVVGILRRGGLFTGAFFWYDYCMELLTLGNELLRQKAQPVTDFGEEIAANCEIMLQAIERENGLAIAAPQLGIMKRFFVTHLDGDEVRVFINPSILETSLETTKAEEGCLSIPTIYASVERPREIKIQAWNEKGRPFTLQAKGFLARVILHEYDHLDGVLFLDRLDLDKRQKLVEKYEKKRAKVSS